jgi:PAS domain-containing protein
MAQPPSVPVSSDMTTRLKLRIRELSIMHEIARAVTSVLDFQSVLNRIVEAAVYLTNAEEGFIMIVDEETNELHLRAGKGLGDKAAKVMSMSVKDSFAEQVISTGKPLRMGGTQKTDKYKVKTGYLVKSILNVPIKGQSRVLGVLSVDHAVESFKTFSDHDVILLTNLAEYAVIAIENAQRYEQAAKRAEELAKSLAEADVKPEIPTRDSDRESLERFNQGLRNQRQEIAQTQEWVISLAKDLRDKASNVEEMAHRLGLWNEEVDNLLPQLDWIAQTALVKKGTGPLEEMPSPDAEIITTLKTLLTHVTDGVLLCDAKGEVLEVNSAASVILQRSPEHLIGEALPMLAPLDPHWDRVVGSLRLALALKDKKSSTPPPSSVTLYVESRIIRATLAPTGINKRKGIALIVFLKDLSAETEAWRACDDALKLVSENLRTPMAAISSYSDLLINESVGLITKGQRRYLERIRLGVDKMEDTLNEFTSRPGSGPSMGEATRVNLADALNEAGAVVKEEFAQADLILSVDISPTLSSVQIPTERFARIVTDLLRRMAAHARAGETIELTSVVQKEEGQPTYLVVAISNQSPHPDIKDSLDDDVDLQAIARAIEYQSGRIWTDIDYAGRTVISFLLPLAT